MYNPGDLIAAGIKWGNDLVDMKIDWVTSVCLNDIDYDFILMSGETENRYYHLLTKDMRYIGSVSLPERYDSSHAQEIVDMYGQAILGVCN